MDNIIKVNIKDEIETDMLDYGMSVISDRAVPSAEDGLKPVQRRILYDMHLSGFFNNKPFVKCARPVGDTMGKFHPHGDSSIYGALAWMSQPWNMRYPLISWHGNNGSRDGDEPASMRYTECKLSKLGEEMLRDIKKDCIDWIPNYDDTEEEPVYLPGTFPNLIANGTSGIAWAMACSFAPHNLKEIMDATSYLIENPECDIKELLNFMKGPDFPTGGLVINKQELATAYLTGRGRARIRGEYEIESSKSGDSIVFTSIPYKVSKEDLIVAIDKLCDQGELNGIVAIRDETNQKGVRFVIELAKGVSAAPVVARLFKSTRLEDTYSFNQVALVNKKPQLLNIKQLLENYIEHQKDVVLRKTKFDLEKINARIHILDGLLIALEDIDNIIALIKKSESAAAAKTALMNKYNLSEVQAKAILDMKLSKLAKLESVEIQNEKNNLIKKKEELNSILKNPSPELLKIFEHLKVNFGDERRTKITQVSTSKEEKEIEYVEPEKCVVVMTEDGGIKRIPSSSFRTQRRNGKGIKNQGDVISATIRTNTIDSLMVFTDKGKMYRILVNDIPVGTNVSKCQSIKSLISMDRDENPTLIYSIYRDTDAKYLLFTTKNGVCKKTSLEEYVNTKKKTGIIAINLKDDDSLVSVNLIKDEDIILLSANGMGMRINSMDISASGRATAGVKGITLKKDDYVVAALPVRDKKDDIAIFAENGLGKRVKASDLVLQKRAGKGLICYKPNSTSGKVAAGALVSEEDSVLVVGVTNSICISAKDIPLLSRGSIGNQIIKGTNISSVSKV